MGLLYGRAGRLTAENGGFRPGQYKYEDPGCALKDLSCTRTSPDCALSGTPLAEYAGTLVRRGPATPCQLGPIVNSLLNTWYNAYQVINNLVSIKSLVNHSDRA